MVGHTKGPPAGRIIGWELSIVDETTMLANSRAA